MVPAVMVSLGGILGALARYYVGLAIAARWGTAFPYATLLINVTGCFLLGAITALAAERPSLMPSEARLLLGVGFCGAYTTFSTFGVDTISLVRTGAWLEAGLYVLLSNILGLAAVVAGFFSARALP